MTFLCLFLGISQDLKAQENKTVTGTVSDNAGGIPSVNIFYNKNKEIKCSKDKILKIYPY